MDTVAGHQRAEEHQQHPIAIYLWIWALLFIFSTFSYLIDYFHLQGYLRWSLIITFMLLKAGFIVAVFMHMARSEEHTSELQSQSNLVCRLLLEIKK